MVIISFETESHHAAFAAWPNLRLWNGKTCWGGSILRLFVIAKDFLLNSKDFSQTQANLYQNSSCVGISSCKFLPAVLLVFGGRDHHDPNARRWRGVLFGLGLIFQISCAADTAQTSTCLRGGRIWRRKLSLLTLLLFMMSFQSMKTIFDPGLATDSFIFCFI